MQQGQNQRQKDMYCIRDYILHVTHCNDKINWPRHTVEVVFVSVSQKYTSMCIYFIPHSVECSGVEY